MRGPQAIGVTLAAIAALHLAAAVASHASRERSPAPAAAAPSTPGSRLFVEKGCVSCHSLHGQGGRVGPALDDVDRRVTRDDLLRRLRDPASVQPRTLMPRIPLTDEEKSALSHFLLEENRR